MLFPTFSLLSISLLASHGVHSHPVILPRQTQPEKFVLPVPKEPPGPTFDATATRAATAAQIRSVASPNLCFDVSDFRAGDFRFNLVPLALKPCDTSIEGQRFDLITKGEHNNSPNGDRTLIVSTQQLTCVDRRSNKNDRTRPGLFACGGRAAGDGETTADQLYFFNGSFTGGFPLVRDAKNNGIGPGNTCLTLNQDGFLSNTPCSPPNFTPEQMWVVDTQNGAPSSSASVPAPSPPAATEPAATSASESATASACAQTVTQTVTVTETVAGAISSTAAPEATTTSASTSAPAPVSTSASTASSTTSVAAPSPTATQGLPEKFVLPVPAEGPGPTFDNTATRAATNVHIRNAASPNTCFDVSDFRSGDFRFNLVPIALKQCNAAIDGQKFDLITKGVHNNVQDGSRTLIVSSQQFTCVDRRSNKNDRSRPGLFACGGRAAGDGETTADQQYFFNKNASLTGGIGFPLVRDSVNNGVGPGNQCLTLNADGFLSNTPCSPPNFTPEQTWFVGNL